MTAERDRLLRLDIDGHAASFAEVCYQRDSARAECERLRKLFDDAGAGEHNVLALIDHYQDEALKATSELVQARQLVASLEDRISDVEDRDDDARTVCEWAATVALKSTDVHNAATRYLTGVQSPLRARLAEVERERDMARREHKVEFEAHQATRRELHATSDAHVEELRKVAALESVAEDARTCAERIVSDYETDDFPQSDVVQAAWRVCRVLAGIGGK